MTPHTRTALLLSALLLPALPTLAQQTAASPDALGPPFEVATVKPTSKDSAGPGQWMGTRLLPSGRLSVRTMSLDSLVYYAYIMRPAIGKVEGGPSWVRSDHFDIEGKLDEAQMTGWDKLTDEERRARVQPAVRALLVERFHLKLHTEMRETQVYAMVQTKGGSKLKQVAEPEELEGDGDKSQRAWKYMADHPGQAAPGAIMCDSAGCRGHAIPVSMMTSQVGYAAGTDGITIDDTGLKGLYDFSYNISHDPDAATPAQQIEDQLGLRFQPRKIPIKTYIIDSADKPQPD